MSLIVPFSVHPWSCLQTFEAFSVSHWEELVANSDQSFSTHSTVHMISTARCFWTWLPLITRDKSPCWKSHVKIQNDEVFFSFVASLDLYQHLKCPPLYFTLWTWHYVVITGNRQQCLHELYTCFSLYVILLPLCNAYIITQHYSHSVQSALLCAFSALPHF